MLPMNGSPDENAHQRYAYAVATAQLPVDADQIVTVPRFLVAEGPECWRFIPAHSAWCAIEEDSMSSAGTAPVPAITQAANYPPLYYAVVGWPLLILDGRAGIIAARSLSALMFSTLAAAGWAALTGRKAPAPAHASALWLLTPGTCALAAGINPQALEIGAALLFAGFAWPLTRSRYVARAPRITGMTLASVLIILSRPSGPIWAVLLTLVTLTALGPRAYALIRGRRAQLFVATSAAACILWAAWRLVTPQTDAYASAGVEDCSWACVADSLMARSWVLARNTVGVTGWDDAWIPGPAAVACLVLLALVAITAAWRGDRSERAAIALGVILVPASALVIERQTVATAGFMWQARYALPLLLPVIWLAADIAFRPARDPAADRRVQHALRAVVLVQGSALSWFALHAARQFWIGIESSDPGHVPIPAVIGMALIAMTVLASAVITLRNLPPAPAARAVDASH